ncbi:MAG: NAD(P)H-dependent oxidoreductase [Bacteroidetes bacterium]|nr:NAD(P)H-dependent oxidoreductase [Bacteroidota bacterium]
MKDNYHFLAISGSLRKKSFNTMVLKAAQKLAPSTIVIEHLSIADIPMYNFDLHEKVFPESIEKICTAIKTADAVIIVTPEYNYSIPGVLKNVIDFLSKHPTKPFDRKAVGIISASPSLLGGVRAQFHLRQILVAVNAITMNIPEVVITQVNTKFDEEGTLNDEKTKEFLKKYIAELADFATNLNHNVLI